MDINLDQLAITPKAESTALVDHPLIDFGNTPEANAAPGSESRPLIDLLINTPDMNKNTVSKPPHEVAQVRSSRRFCVDLGLGWSQFWVWSSSQGTSRGPLRVASGASKVIWLMAHSLGGVTFEQHPVLLRNPAREAQSSLRPGVALPPP